MRDKTMNRQVVRSKTHKPQGALTATYKKERKKTHK